MFVGIASYSWTHQRNVYITLYWHLIWNIWKWNYNCWQYWNRHFLSPCTSMCLDGLTLCSYRINLPVPPQSEHSNQSPQVPALNPLWRHILAALSSGTNPDPKQVGQRDSLRSLI